MSLALPPTTVPSFVVVGKQETVVIEFRNTFSSSQELITLDFYGDAAKKVDTSPCSQLGPNTIKVLFPAFSKPGMIDVVPKIARQYSPLFPKFKIHVASPVEAIYNRLPCSRVQDKKAILSCIITYLTHMSSEDAQDTRLEADTIISTLLSPMPEMPSWDLASILCGGHGTTLNDNLLHFAIQYQLDGMAEILTKHIPKNKDVLWQVSSTKKTPFEMAKKNKMVNVMNTLEQLQARFGPQGEKPGKKNKVKKNTKGHVEQEKGASLSLKVPDSVSLSNSNPSSRTSIISTSSASYSCGGNDNVSCILKALNDISYLYKAKVMQNYQWSSFSHGELSLKVGDIVYVTQENDDEMCMGIVDLSYGQFPKCILQQLNSDDTTMSSYYKVPRIQCVYIDEDNSDSGENPEPNSIYDVPRSVKLQRKASESDTGVPRSYSCDTGLDHIVAAAVSRQQAQVPTLPHDSKTSLHTSFTDLQDFLPKSTTPNTTHSIQVLSSSSFHTKATTQNSSTPSINIQKALLPLPFSRSYEDAALNSCTSYQDVALPSQSSTSSLTVQEATSQPLFPSNQDASATVASLSESYSEVSSISSTSCHEAPPLLPSSSFPVNTQGAAVQLLFSSKQRTPAAVPSPSIEASSVLQSKHKAVVTMPDNVCYVDATTNIQTVQFPEKELILVQVSEQTNPMTLSADNGTAVTSIADVKIAVPEICLETGGKNTSTSPRPVPKPRKPAKLVAPSSGLGPNILPSESRNLILSEPLICIPSAADSSTPISVMVDKPTQAILSDSNTICGLLQTKVIPSPVGPRLKILQTESTPPVSPRLKRLQTESTPPVTPRLKRLQTESTPQVSPRLQRMQTDPRS